MSRQSRKVRERRFSEERARRLFIELQLEDKLCTDPFCVGDCGLWHTWLDAP
jgi:hypothetical protein